MTPNSIFEADYSSKTIRKKNLLKDFATFWFFVKQLTKCRRYYTILYSNSMWGITGLVRLLPVKKLDAST